MTPNYRGQRKGEYTNQRRRSQVPTWRHSRTRSKNVFSQQYLNSPTPADLGTAPTSTPMQPIPELWLKSPTTFTYNGIESKLPTDPAILNRQARELVRIASKRDCEIQLRAPGSKEPIRRFRILRLDPEQPLTTADVAPIDPQVSALKVELETYGWTLLPLLPKEEALQNE